MIARLKSHFQPVTADQVAKSQLLQAERMALVHQAQADYDQALANMYKGMATRLSSPQS